MVRVSFEASTIIRGIVAYVYVSRHDLVASTSPVGDWESVLRQQVRRGKSQEIGPLYQIMLAHTFNLQGLLAQR